MRFFFLFFFALILNAEVIAKGCSYDKKSAIEELLLQISATISTNFSQEKIIYNKTYNNKVSSKLNVKSTSYLQGIKFTNKNNQICAYITRNDLINTINSLKNDLNNLNYKRATLDELNKAYKKAHILKNLAYFINDKKNINYANKIIKKIDFYKNAGSVKFITNASSIIIDNKRYKPYKEIFLSEGKYKVKFLKKGFRELEKVIYINKGEHKIINAVLVKKASKTTKIYLYTNAKFIKSYIKELLLDAKIIATDECINNLAIFLIVKNEKTKVEEYIKNSVRMILKVYKGDKLFFTLRGKIKPFFTTKESNYIYKKKVKLLAKALIKKLLSKIDLSKFSGKKVNYCQGK